MRRERFGPKDVAPETRAPDLRALTPTQRREREQRSANIRSWFGDMAADDIINRAVNAWLHHRRPTEFEEHVLRLLEPVDIDHLFAWHRGHAEALRLARAALLALDEVRSGAHPRHS